MTDARGRAVLQGILIALLVTACDDAATGLPPDGVDLDALFAPATAAEVAAVEAEWAARDPVAAEVVEEASRAVLTAGGTGTARVFSHRVDGARHYGATIVPDGAAAGSLPVVVFAHGGDAGVDASELALVLALLGEGARDFVYVVPSFRSETLRLAELTFVAGGEPSPWDRDVDDALAMLDVALERVPAADPERIGVIGASRGGLVGLLMAVRDPRIDAVAELAGPTDFFSAWVRGLVEDALEDRLQPLPGVHVLNDRFIQPLRRGELSPADVRLELARRSAVLWADRLPPVQLHHGTADVVVPVGQAESLIAALGALQREGDAFHLYPGAGHDLLGAAGLADRLLAFLQSLAMEGG